MTTRMCRPHRTYALAAAGVLLLFTQSACAGAQPKAAAATADQALNPLTCIALDVRCHEGATLAQLDEQLLDHQRQIEALAPKAYAAYLADDPGYISDLIADMRMSSQAWISYRDAHCRADPLIQGMSRKVFDTLVETCRLGKTRARLREMEGLLSALRSNL